ncbi:hypothetical protein PINS_up008479 [Pythium insidiosum]|nr:hypothetical protein PINS_up008479 [Pythium insidiosum]
MAMADYLRDEFIIEPTSDVVTVPSEVLHKIWQTLGKLPSCDVGPTVLLTERRCDADAALPPLGLVFGTHVFYLTKEEYTMPFDKFPGKLKLKIESSTTNLRLGLPFLRKFGVKIALDGKDVTLYCKEGTTCSRGGQSSAAASNSPAPSIAAGDSSSSSPSSTGAIIGIVAAIVVFVFVTIFILRKRRQAQRSREEQQRAEATFLSAQTPQKLGSVETRA